jgi:predicted nuclease of predicted toxin-antitoxin system
VIRLLADENFNNNIVRGVKLREPGVDLVRIQDVGLSGAGDPSVLEWAAEHERVLLTHDVATITAFAYERIRAGKPMPGVFEVSATVCLRSAIDDIVLLAICSKHGEWEAQVRYLPLR